MLLTKWTMNKVTRSNIVPYDKTVYDFGNELKSFSQIQCMHIFMSESTQTEEKCILYISC